MNTYQLYLELQKAIEESPIIPSCQVTDPELWFGTEDENTNMRFKQAKELCSFCPAIKACANYAIAADEVFGVWGGLSPLERKQLRQKHKRGRPRLNVTPTYPQSLSTSSTA